jgi:hypothetical protein
MYSIYKQSYVGNDFSVIVLLAYPNKPKEEVPCLDSGWIIFTDE